jgi:hypothetical protein
MSQNARKLATAAFAIAFCTMIFVPQFAHSQAIQVYESSCFMHFDNSLRSSCLLDQVPTGKQLVIQEFDAQGQLDPGNKPSLFALSTGRTTSHYFTYAFVGSDDEFDYLDTHQATTLYVAGGRSPACFVRIPKVVNLRSTYTCVISGYLVDTTSGQQGISTDHR